jgi:iron complex transport system substrate-binding protein
MKLTESVTNFPYKWASGSLSKNLFWIIALCFLATTNYSCYNSATNSNGRSCDTTICDFYKRKVTFTDNPQRIISAAPGITEIVFALGEGKRLVGRTEFCDFPPQAKGIPSIGGLEDPNIELIATINPDLIIASTHFKKEMVDKIEQLNIPVAVLKNQESFEGAYELIQSIAKILKVKLRADSIIEKMKLEVRETEVLVNQQKSRPSVYFVIGFGKTGDYTAGGNTFIHQLIEMAGGTNIAADLNGWSYSLEKLVEKNPDIILIRTGDKELFCKTSVYKNLKAVKTGRIYEIDNNLFEIAGPRLADGLKQLYTILHPKM